MYNVHHRESLLEITRLEDKKKTIDINEVENMDFIFFLNGLIKFAY